MSQDDMNWLEKQRCVLSAEIYLLEDLIDLYNGGTDEQWHRLYSKYNRMDQLGVYYTRKIR